MDLTNTDFTPIGTEEHPFEGIFEGPSEADKAEIKLSITRNDLDYAGLFGVLGENAEVRNLSVFGAIDNTRINKDTTNDLPTPSSGLITGLMTGDSIIENCVTDAESSVKGQRAGGLVGRIEGGSIINCTNSANVYDIDGQDEGGPGGITGAAAHDTNSTEYPEIIISGCENYGSVETYNTYNVGGIAGEVKEGRIENTQNSGKITGRSTSESSNHYGGIAGTLNNSTVIKATNEGEVTGRSNVGGIAGSANGGEITDSENNAAISAFGTATYAPVGGIVGTATGNLKIKNTNNSGEVEAVRYAGSLDIITVQLVCMKLTQQEVQQDVIQLE